MARSAALIPAAGRGERLGLGPKAFLPLGKHSLLKHVLLAFEGEVDELWVAVSEDMLAEVEAHLLKGTRVIVGGKARQETVYRLLKASSADVVLIHDAARPFLTKTLIAQCLEAAEQFAAITVARAVADTLMTKSKGEIIDRSSLLAVQTPQGFKRDLILKAHEQALEQAVEATDDAALVRLLGHTVQTVEGNPWLNKITTPEDYALAKALEMSWQHAH